MAWPPKQPPREQIAEKEVSAYARVIERARRMRPDADTDAGYYGRLMISPVLGDQLSELGRTVRAIGDAGGSFSHADREFVDQVLSADFATNIVQGVHLNDAVATGVRLEAIQALRYHREEQLTAEEAELAKFIRKVVAGDVDADTWSAMEQRMGERGVIEYAIFILFLQLTMRLMAAVGMPSRSDAEIDALISDLRSGRREVEDFRTRIG